MNIVLQLFYNAYNYASLFLIIFLTKVQAINNHLLKLCQYRGSQHNLPLWNQMLQRMFVIINVLCTQMITFLTPTSAILRTKDPTVVTNDLKRVHSELRHVDRSAVLRHVPEPVVVPQLLTNTDHFEHSSVDTKQLLSELKTPPSLNHVPTPVVKPQIRSNTDHFEHQTIDTDQLNDEIRHHPPLHHVSDPPARVAPTDIELLHAALDARDN